MFIHTVLYLMLKWSIGDVNIVHNYSIQQTKIANIL